MTYEKPDPPPLYFNDKPPNLGPEIPPAVKFGMWTLIVALCVILVVI